MVSMPLACGKFFSPQTNYKSLNESNTIVQKCDISLLPWVIYDTVVTLTPSYRGRREGEVNIIITLNSQTRETVSVNTMGQTVSSMSYYCCA